MTSQKPRRAKNFQKCKRNRSVTSSSENNHNNIAGDELPGFVKEPGQNLVRNKFAILFGFNGKRYHGMQKQNGSVDVITVEGELEKCLYQARGLRSEHLGDFSSSQWSRSGRTDKGVHAACQLVALKLALPSSNNTCEQVSQAERMNIAKLGFLQRLTQVIPKDMVIYDVLPVTKSFNARRYCCQREYMYFFPTNLILSRTNPSNWAPRKTQRSQETAAEKANARTLASLELSDRGMTESEVNRIKLILEEYLGTHSFHNFTSNADETSAMMRTMEKIEVLLKMLGHTEFLQVTVRGRSFMLNQIRKMVALAIEIFRGTAPTNSIGEAFRYGKRFLHMAPAEGLLLHHPIYHTYNTDTAPAAGRLPILPENYADKIDKFVDSCLLPEVTAAAEAGVFHDWMLQVDRHPYCIENVTEPISALNESLKGTIEEQL